MHIPNANILEMVKDKATITIAIEYEIMYRLAYICIWPWPILKVKVKVMHISTVNILEMVIDRVKITITIK